MVQYGRSHGGGRCLGMLAHIFTKPGKAQVVMRHLSWNCLGSRCPRSFLYHRFITQMSALQQWENWRDWASLLSMFQLVLTQDVSLNRWIIPQRQDEIGRLQFAAEGHEDNVDLFFTRDLGDMSAQQTYIFAYIPTQLVDWGGPVSGKS